jgi:hypothetical protein
VSTYRVLLTAVSVQSAKPSYSYSVLPTVPIKDAAAYMLVRAAVSLPKNAVITSAKIWVNQYDSIGGGLTLSVRRNYTAWPKGVTWNTKPAVTDTTHTRALSSAAGLWWDIDVTADVQGFVSGTKANYGWRIMSNSSLAHKWLGSSAAQRVPYLEITYVIPAKVPSGLSPAGGAVSVAKPVLTFAVGSDTLSVQVQVDPAADSVTPDFDSGEIAASAGVVDLADTAYAGLADGSTTYWRARAKNSNGWSAWSAWVDFSRDDLDAVALTDPTTTPADGSPPFVWSFAGTQTAWQATLLDADQKVLDDSGVVAGADTNWTPSKGLVENGEQGTARIRVWDDVTRIATSGIPAYSEDSVDFTVTFDGTVDPMDTLTVSQAADVPSLVFAGTRAAGIPDEVAVFRDGVQVARFPGADIFTSSTDFEWTDWTAPLNVSATYLLAPVVNGAVASGGPTVTVTPTGRGLWLVDPATSTAAVLWGTDEGSWGADDLATVHQPVADGAPPVRRRLRRGTMVGSISGLVLDVVSLAADDTLDALATFRANDAGTEYRLIAGHLNLAVIAGDFLVAPTPLSSGGDVIAKAQFNFWGV